MAILGTYIDRALNTRAGDDLAGVTLTTLAHSLATAPDAVIPVLRSIAGVGDLNVFPKLLALRGNGSLNTIGFAAPTGVSTATIDFEVLSFTFHSKIR